jgi:hypothetical protein
MIHKAKTGAIRPPCKGDGGVVLDARLFNVPRWHLGRPTRLNMRIPPEITKSVVFLGCRAADGGLSLRGTAFVACVPGKKRPFRYLVTARHNVLALRGRVAVIRLNTNDGCFRVVDLGDSPRWWFHPTEEWAVDAAVLPFEMEEADVAPIPLEMFLSDATINNLYIGQGDEVTITGLFTKLTGENKNLPIVRRGSVAMLPEDTTIDRIPSVNLGEDRPQDIEGYLVEVRSVGGLSGSPVFVRPPIGLNCGVHDRQGKYRTVTAHIQGDYCFLGLAQGHWEIPPDKRNKVDFPSARSGEDSIDLGIAIVVPAKKIREVLEQSGLAQMRNQREEELRQAEGTTTPDAKF